MKVLVAAAMVAAVIPKEAAASPYTLACNVKSLSPVADGSFPVVDLPVLVSPEHGTVNGDPAAITDTLISWTDNSGGQSENAVSYVIVRKKMTVSVYGDGSRLFAAGTCVAPMSSPASPNATVSTPSGQNPVDGSGRTSSTPFTLACRMESFHGHEPLGEKGYIVDPASSTVDGHKAEFTPRQISFRWDDGKKKDLYLTIIDRITGSILVERKGELLLEGTCAPESGPKF